MPAGPLEHGELSLQAGARRWVTQLTGHRLGYLEQLYTFADADRRVAPVGGVEAREPDGRRSISIGYLALTRGALVEAPSPPSGSRRLRVHH